MTKKTFSIPLSCTGTVTTETFTLDACVATTPTSSTQSLGYKQWSYVKAIPAPKKTGYSVETKYALTYCTSVKSIMTYKLNDCIIDGSGFIFTETISETPYANSSWVTTLTTYSDKQCKTPKKTTLLTTPFLDYCDSGNRDSASILNNPFQLTSMLPMVVQRYSTSIDII